MWVSELFLVDFQFGILKRLRCKIFDTKMQNICFKDANFCSKRCELLLQEMRTSASRDANFCFNDSNLNFKQMQNFASKMWISASKMRQFCFKEAAVLLQRCKIFASKRKISVSKNQNSASSFFYFKGANFCILENNFWFKGAQSIQHTPNYLRQLNHQHWWHIC